MFVEILRIAKQMKLLTLETVALEGTKLHANASRHRALSYGQAEKNDKQQISPMLHTLGRLPEELRTVTQILADAGYYSAANVERCVAANVAPFIAAGRESHHLPWEARFTEPAPLPDGADAVARMKHRLKIRAGWSRVTMAWNIHRMAVLRR